MLTRIVSGACLGVSCVGIAVFIVNVGDVTRTTVAVIAALVATVLLWASALWWIRSRRSAALRRALVIRLVGVTVAAVLVGFVGISIPLSNRGMVVGSHAAAVKLFDSSAAKGTSIATDVVIVSDETRSTHLTVAVVRPRGQSSVPALFANFDGSGGGEARSISCASYRRSVWTVAPGHSQSIDLACSGYVAPWQMRAVEFVWVG